MRALLAATAASVLALTVAGAAVAEPVVSVAIGDELQSKADRFGQREIDELTKDLTRTMTRALERSGAQRADLVLEAAVPNRPTFEQMGRRPGLSFWSRGLGGASLTGTITTADGAVQPVSYRWYETNWWITRGNNTWTDAERAFDMFAHRVARGDLPNQGPHRKGSPDSGMFGSFGTARF